MAGSLSVASRTMMPFPHTNPSTLPVLTTRKTGLFSLAARARASVRETSQRGLAQGWFLSASWLQRFVSAALKTAGAVSPASSRDG